MAPSNSKANYKTYEAQARMVRAIVAAHPEVKWNYKEIAACYGSDMSEHALNHRFRKIRAQSLVIKTGRERGFDMRRLSVDENELPSTKEGVDQKNIAKYFGQSTADGIQFQFRTYKKDAEKLRTVHSSGGNVANCLPLSTLATPSKASPSRTTPTSRASTARKRPLGAKIKRSSSDDEDEASADPEDWSDGDGDETPSRRPSKHARTATAAAATPATASTPSRRLAANKANATIAHVSAQLGRDESPDDSSEETATVSQSTSAEYKSLFGDTRASANGNGNGNGNGLADSLGEGLTTFSLDPYISSTMSRSVYSDGLGRDDAYGDGEI